MNLNIKEVDKSNFSTVKNLHPKKEQLKFVPTIMESIALAYIRPSNSDWTPLVIFLEDKPIAFTSFVHKHKDYSWCSISGFFIDTPYQQKGLANPIIRTIIEYAKSKGYLKLGLCVDKLNKKAISLYEKSGFKEEVNNKSSDKKVLNMFLSLD